MVQLNVLKDLSKKVFHAYYPSGLHLAWWVEAAACFCFLANLVDANTSGGNAGYTPYQARFQEECKAKLVQFGQEIEYYPIDPNSKLTTHKFGEKTKKGMFMGYKQSVRSGGKWTGDYFVFDYDDIRKSKSYKQIVLTTVKGSELTEIMNTTR